LKGKRIIDLSSVLSSKSSTSINRHRSVSHGYLEALEQRRRDLPVVRVRHELTGGDEEGGGTADGSPLLRPQQPAV